MTKRRRHRPTPHCLEPLSARGSVMRYGGRFNIGAEVGSGAFESFPALYLAQDVETAFREFFQIDATSASGGLSREEFALKRPGGFLSAEAGFEAILYPSAKNGRRCMAVFPRNLRQSDSFVAIAGAYPHAVVVPRLDAETASQCT
jgi:RES domain